MIPQRTLLTIPLLFLSLFCNHLYSATLQKSPGPLAVFELNHRSAKNLLPIIKPFLDPKAVIRAVGNKLLIRTNRSNLDEVTRLITYLDKQQRKLRITLRQTTAPRTNNINSDSNAPTIMAQSTITTSRTSYKQQQGTQHTIYVLEGQKAWIQSAKSKPVISEHSRWGTKIRQQTNTRGFYVVADLTNNGVEVKVLSKHQRQINGSRRQTFGTSTTLNGRLGVWFDMGETKGSQPLKEELSDHSTTITRTANKQASIFFQLKVELAR